MAGEFTLYLYDTGLTPNTVTIPLHVNVIRGSAERDIKIFDLGVMAFIVEDILGGYKLPNFITDWGRHKERITVEGEINDQLHDPIWTELWTLRKRLLLDSYRYKANYIEIGTDVTVDNISSQSAGAGKIYVRVKDFNWSFDHAKQGCIPYQIQFYVGKVIRIID